MRRFATFLSVVAALAVAVALTWRPQGAGRPAAPPGPVLHGVAVRAVDGDTLVVRLDGGGRERVRVIGVDTPEDVAPGRPVECYSRRAAAFTARVVTRRRVVLRVGRERRDRYGRLLAYVRVEGASSDLEDSLLRRGLARPLPIAPNTDHAAAYATLAARAQTAGRGLWSACPRLAAEWEGSP
jgi:micrococcal nuclease